MNTLLQDLHYGLRVLRKRPGFTAIAIVTLSLGVGANTALFSVVDAVLLRQLPIRDPDRVVTVFDQLPKLNLPRTQVSALQYFDYSRQSEAFESTAALIKRGFNITGTDTPERLQAGRVTSSFFPLLGINPLAGRFFAPEEDSFGNQHVAVLSQSLWRRLFLSDSGVLSRMLQLDGENYQVIGVAPAGLEQLYSGVDLWIPMAFSQNELSEPRRWSLGTTMIARLKAGVNLAGAQAIMSNVAQEIANAGQSDFNIELRTMNEDLLGEMRKPLYVLLCAVAVVLLIACGNIANLLLALAGARTREIAIRTALGAQRGRIVRQLLIESMLLALLGGVLGVLLAWWGMSALTALAPADLPRINEVSLNAGVLGFTLTISLVSGLLFGLFPALATSRVDLAGSLKESGRSDSGRSTDHRLRGALVIAEVALAFVLLISAGLLVRSFAKLLDVRPGFDTRNVITARLALPRSKYADTQRVRSFYDSVVERVSGLPSVVGAAVAWQPPFIGGDNSVFQIRDRQAGPDEPPPHADYAYVTAGYFSAMGIPLLKGRDFQPSEMWMKNFFEPGSVTIIDEELAKRYWPNGDALGGGISWGAKGPWATIVGIVGTVHWKDVAEESKGSFYLPVYSPAATIVVRTAGDSRSLKQAIRDQVFAVDPSQPVYDIQTMDERVSHTLARRRFAMALLGVFSALALLLAATGLYGVLAFVVALRNHEIGIRMAIGAQAGDVLRLVIRHGMTLAVVGLVIGLGVSLAVTRLMSSLLYDVSPADPLTFVVFAFLLAGVALLACYIPARRATKVDPMIALRYE